MVRKTIKIIENTVNQYVEFKEQKYKIILPRIFKILKSSPKFSDLRLDCLSCLDTILRWNHFPLWEYFFQMIPVLIEIILKENLGKTGCKAMSLLSSICVNPDAVPYFLEYNGIQVILKSLESSGMII